MKEEMEKKLRIAEERVATLGDALTNLVRVCQDVLSTSDYQSTEIAVENSVDHVGLQRLEAQLDSAAKTLVDVGAIGWSVNKTKPMGR